MKRIVSLFIFICFFTISFFSSEAFGAAKKKKYSIKQKIEFVTSDKFLLVGDIYLPDEKRTNKPLIVMLHSFSMSATVWQNLATALREKGYYVLAMDLRGHGRSVYTESLKLKSRFKFNEKDWKKLPKDVIESINYTKANYPYANVNDIIIIGADLGAGAGIIAGKLIKKEPKKMVLISPQINFKGLYIPVIISKYKNTKFLVLLSKTEKMLFAIQSQTPPIIKTYPVGGAGNMLIKQNPISINDIVNFIGE